MPGPGNGCASGAGSSRTTFTRKIVLATWCWMRSRSCSYSEYASFLNSFSGSCRCTRAGRCRAACRRAPSGARPTARRWSAAGRSARPVPSLAADAPAPRLDAGVGQRPRRCCSMAARPPMSQSSSAVLPSSGRPSALTAASQPVEVPVVEASSPARWRSTSDVDLLVEEGPHRLGQVLVAEDLVALGVDRLALLVDDVVVLDDALADVEVVALDPGLGALDRLETSRDSIATSSSSPMRSIRPGHAVRREALHQVVLERQVEARRSRVALAAGAAAQLVVDPARVVAFGADDVQAARRDDGLVLDGALRLRLGEGCVVHLGDASAGLMPRLWSASDASPAGLPPSRMSVPRPAMFVAIVTAPLRPAWATMLASRSWNLALRTSCWMPRFRSISARCSLFSTLTVPTRTGRPCSRQLDDLVDQRVELALLVAEDEVRHGRRGSSAGGSGPPTTSRL